MTKDNQKGAPFEVKLVFGIILAVILIAIAKVVVVLGAGGELNTAVR